MIEAARAGDVDSFGTLCTAYYSPMVAVAYSVLKDHQLAEDAAQEAFARGFVGLRNLKKTRRFAPWLAQICRNVAIDMVRARVQQGQAVNGAKPCEPDRDDSALEMVREAIDALPKSMKEVVVLRYYDSCSYEQISAVLGVSKMTINGRLTRARRKLLRTLRQNGFPENSQ